MTRVGYLRIVNLNVFEMDRIPELAIPSMVTNAVWMDPPTSAGALGMFRRAR